MILAAGLGERMRPLTDHTPKPLLEVAGIPLLEHHIRRLGAAGYRELVINVSHLGEQIETYCESGSRWGVSIAFSHEHQPLETAGGIQRALPLLGNEPFLVVNGDIWTDYDFARLQGVALSTATAAHLVMVDNPPQHPLGDFVLDTAGRVRTRADGITGMTYSGIGVFDRAFFAAVKPGKLRLRPLLDDAILAGVLGGEYYPGDWEDVGTPERLRVLDARVRSSHAVC